MAENQKAPIDSKVEGWTWTHGGRKWCYYRDRRAICGKQFLMVHPSEGYELGNDGSESNCLGCKRKLLKEKETAEATS